MTAPDAQRLGIAQRLLHVLAGTIVGLGAVFIAILLITAGFTVQDGRGRLAASVAGLLFAALSGLGWKALVQGVRGSSRVSERHRASDELIRRHGVLLTVGLGAVMLVGFRLLRGTLAPPSPRGDPMPALLWYAAACLVLFPLQVAIHELGHALAALAVGIRVESVRVVGLLVQRVAGRFRLSWTWTWKGSGDLAGQVTFVPVPVARWRYLFVLLAGPAASLASALVFHGAWERAAAASAGREWTGALLASAVAGLGMFGTNAFPYATRSGFRSDGARAIALYREPAGYELLQRLYSRAPGLRPRHWGCSAQETAEAARRAVLPLRPAIFFYAQAIARDQGDHSVAHAQLHEALETATWDEALGAWAWRMELELQAVMEDALLNGAPAEARRRLDALPPHRDAPAYPLLAQATVVLAEGGATQASELLRGWETAAEESRLGRSRLLVGNEWAIDAIRERVSGVPSKGSAES